MVVYGTKAKVLVTETVVEKCASCGKMNSVDVTVLQKYFHIFWIPCFPIGKTGASVCAHCKQTLALKEMPEAMRLAYSNLKAQTKTPIYMFSGLFVIVVLAILLANSIRNDKKENTDFLQAPQKGDVYEIYDENGSYTLYKAYEIVGDTVFVLLSNFQANKISGLRKINQQAPDAWSEDPAAITKPQLLEMLEKGEIIDVQR